MKNLKKQAMRFRSIYVICITFLFLGISLFSTNAQEAIVTSGGEASSGGGSVSYTVGQVVYTTNSSAAGTVSQGIQQPYEISVSTAVENTSDILLDFTAYPNPTTDILKLRTGNRNFESVTFQLFDMNGKLIKNGKVAGSETSINMEALSPSVYFLKIIEKDKEIKTFKIIKR